MLLLVLAGNFVFLLAGWGLVGLSSYLLIGFWWQRPSAVAAAKKAFVMNAIGDVGMTLGIFVIWNHLHTVDYATAFALAPGSIGAGSSTANWIALLLLVGAVAKSAQLPLQTWLPDAMEGPTPVSALIHAATMVTAGVYLVARMWPFYSLAPDISDLVAIVGVATLTLAGLIALVQTDIKRVIAYSTMSQIGYMFCGVGIGAYSSGMFLLVMHAFFKALLFLGAGVVIHALDDEQDMRKMGGMSRYLPYYDRPDVDRRARARGGAAVLGLLLEGSDPRRRARARRLGRLHGLGARAGGRVRHRALHVPPDAARVPRGAQRVRARAGRGARRPRRGAVLDALDDRRARRGSAVRGLAGDPAGHARDAQLPRADDPLPARGDRQPGPGQLGARRGPRARRALRGVHAVGPAQ